MKEYGIFYFDEHGIHSAFPLLDGLITYQTLEDAERRISEISNYMSSQGERLPITILPIYS